MEIGAEPLISKRSKDMTFQHKFISRLIDVKEAAGWLGVTPQTLYKMVSQRRVPYVKVGGALKFDPDKLQAWIKDNSVMPMPKRNS
jgi:excisionase family DNA binding protein